MNRRDRTLFKDACRMTHASEVLSPSLLQPVVSWHRGAMQVAALRDLSARPASSSEMSAQNALYRKKLLGAVVESPGLLELKIGAFRVHSARLAPGPRKPSPRLPTSKFRALPLARISMRWGSYSLRGS